MVIGNQTVGETYRRVGVDDSRLILVPCGIKINHFRPVSDVVSGPVFLHAATRVSYRKGSEVLAQAWPLVAEKVPAARLVVLGWDGDYGSVGLLKGRGDVRTLVPSWVAASSTGKP